MVNNAELEKTAEQALIAFRVGRHEFCIDVRMVHEIRGWAGVTLLPRAPGYIKGVINLRGAVLPVVDLSERLGLPNHETKLRNVVIVIQIGTRRIGVLVDAVSDILTTNSVALQGSPDLSSDLVRNFVKGLLSVDGRMIALITLEHILPDSDLESV